jgi:hypothetical protein
MRERLSVSDLLLGAPIMPVRSLSEFLRFMSKLLKNAHLSSSRYAVVYVRAVGQNLLLRVGVYLSCRILEFFRRLFFRVDL